AALDDGDVPVHSRNGQPATRRGDGAHQPADVHRLPWLARLGVQEPHIALGPSTNQPAPEEGDGDVPAFGLLAPEGLAGSHAADDQIARDVGRGDGAAVRAEGYGPEGAAVSVENADGFPGLRVPQADFEIVATRGDPAPVGRPGNGH